MQLVELGPEKMKRVQVSLTAEEREVLGELASIRGATPGELLAAFVADLTWSKRYGGGDERMHAQSWYERQVGRWNDGKMTT